MKIIWKVAEKPTGPYRSFSRRGWPTAYYFGDDQVVCAFIYCQDDYVPSLVKTGDHGELIVAICDHSVTPWVQQRLKRRAATLAEAKGFVLSALAKHPHFVPSPHQK